MMQKIQMLVSVEMPEGYFVANGIYKVPAALAEQLVRENAARCVPAPAPEKTTHPREAWRKTVRPGDAFDWQITLNLPRLLKPYIRGRYEPTPFPSMGRKSDRFLEVGGVGIGRGPFTQRSPFSPTQAKAINYLIKHEAKLYAELLSAIASYASRFRSHWETVDLRTADRVIPRNMSPRQVAERIAFRSIYLPRRSRGGIGYVEFRGECTWDREHGFNVVLHRNRVVSVMQQGTGWTDRRSKRRR